MGLVFAAIFGIAVAFGMTHPSNIAKDNQQKQQAVKKIQVKKKTTKKTIQKHNIAMIDGIEVLDLKRGGK